MKEPKKVHLRDMDGNVKYNMLLDDGGHFLSFGGNYPCGSFARTTIERERLVICDGWRTLEEMEASRWRRWPELMWVYSKPSERETAILNGWVENPSVERAAKGSP